MLTLKVEQRDTKEKPETLREKGKVPAVFYGPKEKSTPVMASQHDFEKVWREAGESTVVQLHGVGEDKEALIHEVDVHPVTSVPRHADFYVFEKGKKIEVDVPLEFIGESPAVKELGGTLVKVLHELEVEVLPKDLPHEIKVNVSSLTDFDSLISVKDIVLPEGVVALAQPDDVVMSVAEPKEEEEEPAEEIDMDSIEVEGEKERKEREETEEGDETKKSGGDETPREKQP